MDEPLVVPQLLDLPEKLLPIMRLTNDYRYFLLEGGRGGAKSQSVARFILYLADRYDLRIVCGRETQNSINESVYSLFADLVRDNNLNFDVLASKIVSRRTGTTINFRGFREQGAFNIQGMEGVDILWVDEAQAITKQTLDVLIPTIRKDNAKIFFTMNRHVHNDPVYVFCTGRADCLHISINYMENKHCTQALKTEAMECLKKSQSDYEHIWLGMPLSKSEDQVFSHAEMLACAANKFALRQGYGLRLIGFDIARFGDDKCAAVNLQQMGALHWATIFSDEWDHKDLNYTTGRILLTTNEQDATKGIIDEDGIGAGPLDTLNKGRGDDRFVGFKNPNISYNKDKEYANPRTRNAYKLKDMILKGQIYIPQQEIRDELETLKYTFDHNQRRMLIPKDIMKQKFKIKSPNLADALIMAVSLIGEVQEKQEEDYTNQKQPNISKEEDILYLAGIK